MRRCSCGRHIDCAVYRGAQIESFAYLVYFDCQGCRSTMAVVLWQDEEMALAEHEERLAAEQYEAEQAPLDRAATRPFFSIAHELAELGL